MYEVFLQMDAPVELFAKIVDIGFGVVSVALAICVFIHHLLDVRCLYRYLHDVYRRQIDGVSIGGSDNEYFSTGTWCDGLSKPALLDPTTSKIAADPQMACHLT